MAYLHSQDVRGAGDSTFLAVATGSVASTTLEPGFHHHCLGESHSGLELAALVQDVPAGVRDVVEGIADDHAVSGVAERWRRAFDDVFRYDARAVGVEREEHDAAGVRAILYGKQSIASTVQAVDALECVPAASGEPRHPLRVGRQQAQPSEVVGDDELSTVGRHR